MSCLVFGCGYVFLLLCVVNLVFCTFSLWPGLVWGDKTSDPTLYFKCGCVVGALSKGRDILTPA